MTNQGNWRRVNATKHCPVCDKPDWCAVSADGAAALCQRVESSRRIGEAGWLHRLKEMPREGGRRVRVVRLGSASAVREDLARMARGFEIAVDPGRLCQLATSLGLSVHGLCQFGVGWSAEHRAWSFPMTDAAGNVLGIRLRRPNGYKFAVTGGREGLFLPSAAQPQSMLVVTEGPTDAAALFDMGFPKVAGRPSCSGGIKLLVELVRKRQAREVVVVADGDEPGRRGADNLASVLVAYAPAVRVIVPPENVKDARAWLQGGGSRNEVERAIEAADVRRLKIRSVIRG